MTSVGGDTISGDDTEEDSGTERLPTRQDGHDIFIRTCGTDTVLRPQAMSYLFGVLS